MTREFHRRARTLFEQAVELAPTERDAFLDKECLGTPDLKREVELLLFHDQPEDGAPVVLQREAASFVSEAAVLPPTIGRYVIERELGRGGMGIVYLGLDATLHRRVAIKTLPPHLAEAPRRLALLDREARLIASINHPNIAVVYSLEDADGTRFLTMEYVEGENLSERIAEGPLSVESAVGIARGLARALETAHAKGVVHRDVKPGNVRISAEGIVKVLDFGIAATFDSETPPSGSGTPRYMSPERKRGEEGDTASDVWAFGCVLFEMLHGVPFDAETGFTPEPLASTVPAELSTLVGRCLARDPNERLDSMATARRRIDELARRLWNPPAEPDESTESPPTVHGLPQALSRFVGRTTEMKEIEARLADHRVLTLTGVGGVGKTRLAAEVARRLASEFSGDSYFTTLVAVESEGAVAQEVANTFGVSESADQSLDQLLCEAIGNRKSLLVFDNCEHVVEACARLTATLMQACPRLTVLATSREPLRIPGEAVYRVPSLTVPESGSEDVVEPLSFDSIRLFVERADAALSGFRLTDANRPSIVSICRRLDGVPLAIELAAARAGSLTVQEIAKRLDQRFQLLVGNQRTALPRHRTLRSTIDWSHEQLDDTQQRVFRSLSVFAGGWTLEAAEAVCDDPATLDFLTDLVDKSLVELTPTDGGFSRYRFLETVREYALEKLRAEPGEEDDLRLRHARHFLAKAEEARPQLSQEDQGTWRRGLERDRENHVSAVRHDLAEGRWEDAANHIKSLEEFWYISGHWRLASDLIRATLDPPTGLEDKSLIFDLERAYNLHAKLLGIPGAKARIEFLLKTADELDDDRRRLAALSAASVESVREADPVRSRALTEEVLVVARRLDIPRQEAIALYNLSLQDMDSGDLESARKLQQESLRIRRREGLRRGVGMSLGVMGSISKLEGRAEESARLLEESAEILEEVGDLRELTVTLVELADARFLQGHTRLAGESILEALSLCKEHQLDYREVAIRQTAMLVEKTDPVGAAFLLSAAKHLREEMASVDQGEGISEREEAELNKLWDRLQLALPEGEAERVRDAAKDITAVEAVEAAISKASLLS